MSGSSLPPGQKNIGFFPRFGLWQFARYKPQSGELSLTIRTHLEDPIKLESGDLESVLRKLEQVSDFHCVTTWSTQGLRWEGYRFREFLELIVVPRLGHGAASAKLAVFRSADGYRTFMYMDDLLADDVLLATGLNGNALPGDHGGPLRLVAPAHYGFKSAKHIVEICFQNDLTAYRSPALHWHEHPRARVVLEERGGPKLFWRLAGRLSIPLVLFWYRRWDKIHRT